MDERDIIQFERSAQTYFVEGWKYFWAILGTIGVFTLVFSGIYFSRIAFAHYLGDSQEMTILTWGASIAISALEVGGVTLLGNKIRSNEIRRENRLEHTWMSWFTYTLFGFDIISNAFGLWIVIYAFLNSVPLEAYLLIGGLSILMGGSELMVGWMLRSLAVSYAAFIRAKDVFTAYQRKREKELEKIETQNEFSKEQHFNNSNSMAETQRPMKKSSNFSDNNPSPKPFIAPRPVGRPPFKASEDNNFGNRYE